MTDIIRFPHLDKAPIKRAMFNVRYNLAAPLTAEQVNEVCSKGSRKFISAEAVGAIQAEVKLQPGKDPVFSTQKTDSALFRLTSEEPNVVATISQEEASVVISEPYKDWKHLLAFGQSLLESIASVVDIESYHRFALRYFNELKIEDGLRDFHDYLTAPPDPPPRIPQTLIEFSSRIVIPLQKEQSFAIIKQEFNPAARSVILDIDCMHVEAIESLDDRVWHIYASLRDEKNRLFFESITERMVALCK